MRVRLRESEGCGEGGAEVRGEDEDGAAGGERRSEGLGQVGIGEGDVVERRRPVEGRRDRGGGGPAVVNHSYGVAAQERWEAVRRGLGGREGRYVDEEGEGCMGCVIEASVVSRGPLGEGSNI